MNEGTVGSFEYMADPRLTQASGTGLGLEVLKRLENPKDLNLLIRRFVLLYTFLPVLLLGLTSCEGIGQSKESGAGSDSADANSTHDEDSMMTWKEVLRFARNGNPAPDRRVEKSDEEWRKLLTREQYAITRAKGTERPYTGEYCSSHEPGVYACVGCKTVLFDSREKFESGTGWPSFSQPTAPNVIAYVEDGSYGMERIEVLCSVCDAHLGHVFPDGPGKGGLRYCINSASLVRVSDK